MSARSSTLYCTMHLVVDDVFVMMISKCIFNLRKSRTKLLYSSIRFYKLLFYLFGVSSVRTLAGTNLLVASEIACLILVNEASVSRPPCYILLVLLASSCVDSLTGWLVDVFPMLRYGSTWNDICHGEKNGTPSMYVYVGEIDRTTAHNLDEKKPKMHVIMRLLVPQHNSRKNRALLVASY